jgi:hypothetical protein
MLRSRRSDRSTRLRKLIEKGRFPNAYRMDPFNPQSHYRIPKQDVERFQKARVLVEK